MRKFFLFCFIPFLCLFCNKSLNAQNKRDLGIQIGTSYYYGEFNENKPLYKPTAAFGAIFRYNYNRFYSIRLSGAFSEIKGESTGYEATNTTISFEKRIINFEAMLEFNFIEFNPMTSHQKKLLAPYANVGIGGIIVDGKVISNLPFSAGIKYTPGKRHTFALEWRFHKAFTDKIDDHSLPSEKSAIIHNNDWISFVSFIYTYRLFDHGQLCPVYK